MKKILLIPLSFFIGSLLWAQPMSLEDFNARFETEIGKLIAQREKQSKELDVKYLGALLRLESQAKNQGDVELLLAVRNEIARVENGREITEEDKEVPASLQDMRKVMAQHHSQYRKEEAEGVITLVDNLKPYAKSRSAEATRQNNIPEALAWRNWVEGLDENPTVSAAYAFAGNPAGDGGGQDENDLHAALAGEPEKILAEKSNEYSRSPKAYQHGMEPEGKEKNIRSSTPSMQGAGNSLLHGTVILIEEKDIQKSGFYGSFKEKSLVYVPRISISPLPGKRLDRFLVVFDLYKRGSGSKRSVIRTDSILLPGLNSGERVVVDAGLYEYETEEYDSHYSDWDYKTTTADEFYGYIVTIFNQKGELIYQRATERILNDYARTAPPSDQEQAEEPDREED